MKKQNFKFWKPVNKKKTKIKINSNSIFKPNYKRTVAEKKLIRKNPWGDRDGDGVPNWIDCKPFDRMKQSFIERKKKDPFFKHSIRGYKKPAASEEKIKMISNSAEIPNFELKGKMKGYGAEFIPRKDPELIELYKKKVQEGDIKRYHKKYYKKRARKKYLKNYRWENRLDYMLYQKKYREKLRKEREENTNNVKIFNEKKIEFEPIIINKNNSYSDYEEDENETIDILRKEREEDKFEDQLMNYKYNKDDYEDNDETEDEDYDDSFIEDDE